MHRLSFGYIKFRIGTATITSNIPANGYVIGNTYTITITGVKANCIKFGFELTAENGNSKSGDFMITDNTTKLVNANNAVTHKSSGTSGIQLKAGLWTGHQLPIVMEILLFMLLLMFSNANSNNNGDNVFTTSLSVNEEVVNAISDNNTSNSFHL